MYINELESEFSCQDIPGANCAGFVAGWLTGWTTLVCHFSPSSSGKVTDDSGIPYWKCTDFLVVTFCILDLGWNIPTQSSSRPATISWNVAGEEPVFVSWFDSAVSHVLVSNKAFSPKTGVVKDYWYLDLNYCLGAEKRRLKVLVLSDVESCTVGSGAKLAKQTFNLDGVWIQFGSLRPEMNHPLKLVSSNRRRVFPKGVHQTAVCPSDHKTINLYIQCFLATADSVCKNPKSQRVWEQNRK